MIDQTKDKGAGKESWSEIPEMDEIVEWWADGIVVLSLDDLELVIWRTVILEVLRGERVAARRERT